MPYYTCDVTGVGPVETGEVYLQLTEQANSFPETWFRAAPAANKEILAVGLAAINSGASVKVRMQSTDGSTDIERIFIIAN